MRFSVDNLTLWTKEYFEKKLADYNENLLEGAVKETNMRKVKKVFSQTSKTLRKDYLEFIHKKLRHFEKDYYFNVLFSNLGIAPKNESE